MIGKGVARFIDPVVAAFALPSIPMAIMNYPIATIVPVIYAKQFSIPLIQIGSYSFSAGYWTPCAIRSSDICRI